MSDISAAWPHYTICAFLSVLVLAGCGGDDPMASNAAKVAAAAENESAVEAVYTALEDDLGARRAGSKGLVFDLPSGACEIEDVFDEDEVAVYGFEAWTLVAPDGSAGVSMSSDRSDCYTAVLNALGWTEAGD